MRNVGLWIREKNSTLSRCRMVIHHGDRVYIRSTKFPLKPGSKNPRPELATGYKSSPLELDLAYAVAKEVDGQLIRGTFDWNPWLLPNQQRPEHCEQWLDKLERDYFRRRGRSPKTLTTWSKSYAPYFQKLPPERELTERLLVDVLLEYNANTRSRQACSIAFGMLAAFAGIERREICELGKGYRQPKKQATDILTDSQVLFQLRQIENIKWQRVAVLLAVFGLRNHEVFKADLSRVEEGVLYIPPDTKTGERVCYACPADWIEVFGLSADMELPAISTKNRPNRDIGAAVTRQFKRIGLSTPYTFRDSYAIRLEFLDDASITPAFKSRWMGHSPTVHDTNYLDAIQEIHHERMFARLKKGF